MVRQGTGDAGRRGLIVSYRNRGPKTWAKKARILLSVSAGALSCALWTVPVRAADSDQIETVTVTAEKRPENVQKVPMSVSAFSGDALERANIVNMSDLAKLTPSLQIIQANNNRNTTIEIRNIGSSGTNPGIEPSVGIFLDDVYIPVAGPIFNDLLDVSTVEVLRGPQGTLYGRNTPVGAINITSRAPSQTDEAMIDVTLGNYDERRVSGFVGGGLTDDLAGRLSFWTDTHSGYEKNVFYNDQVNGNDQWGGRGRLRWTPDDKTTVDVIGYYSRINANGTVGTQIDPFGIGGIATPGFLASAAAQDPAHPFVALKKFEVNENDVPSDITTLYGGSVNVTRELPLGPSISFISAYNYFDDYLRELSADGLPQNVGHGDQEDKIKSGSEEVRLVSPGQQFIDYVAGIYLFHDDLSYINNETAEIGANRVFPGTGPLKVGDTSAFDFGQRTNSAAFYGQATMNVTDALRLTGGLRYSYDWKKASIFNVDSNPSGAPSASWVKLLFPPTNQTDLKRIDHSLTWLAGAQYDITEGVMAYVTTGSGFKDGGFNARAASGPPFTFGPENSLTYEAGVKTTLFDDHLLLNADAYRLLLHGFQQSTLNPITGAGFVVGNAGDVKTDGIEVDAQAHVLDHLSLTGALSYADSTFTQYPEGQCITTYPKAGSAPPVGSPQVNPAHPGTCNYTGFTPSYAPKWQWSTGGQWEQPWQGKSFNWFVGGDLSYEGSQYMDASLDPRSFQRGYTLLSAQLGIESAAGTWRVSLWGRNLTNKAYFATEAAEPLGALIGAGGTASANGFFGWYGNPRTFGIDASYHF